MTPEPPREAAPQIGVPAGLWWLSFTDPDIAASIPEDQRRPGGPSFLGVCIVEAITAPGAVIAAHQAGCNPGGEVTGLGPLPLDTWAPEWRNRLLSHEEAQRCLAESGVMP